MKLPVLGGTVLLGRHVVAQALDAGLEVTLLHRGRRGTGLFPAARTLIGDRDGDLWALEGRDFDAVIDCSGYSEAQLARSAAALAAVPRCLFVSSISVGAAFPRGPAASPTGRCAWPWAAWCLQLVEQGVTGTFNAIGDLPPMRELLDTCREISSSDALEQLGPPSVVSVRISKQVRGPCRVDPRRRPRAVASAAPAGPALSTIRSARESPVRPRSCAAA